MFGVLRSAEWGWIKPKAGGPSWAGLSPTIWLILGGLFVIWVFFRWESRRESRGEEPLVRPAMLRNRQLTGGLTMFFFQYLVQTGFFFVVPLFLSVALGLSAIETGVRLLPLSVTLLAAAIGIPRCSRHVSPRLVVRVGLLALLAGTVVLLGALDADAGARDRLRADAPHRPRDRRLASQLGAVTVSAVPDDESPEVGGIQNTMTNLGASFGTALAGSLLIAAMTSAFLTNIAAEPGDPRREAKHRRRSSSPAASRSSPTPTSRRPSRRRGRPRDHGRDARRLRRRAHRRAPLGARDPRAARGRRAVPRAEHPHEAGRRGGQRVASLANAVVVAYPRDAVG